MKIAEIKKVAADYSGLSLGLKGKIAKIESEAFIIGAEWRIDSVWHKPCEIAEPGKDCLVEHIDREGNVCLCIDWRSEYEWVHAVYYDKVVRWVYIKDLLPNTEDDNGNKNKNVMKKFIGTKTVVAEPMTKADAKECGYRVNDNNPEQDGYEVTYEDGYKSWSPKTPFDKAYKPISPSNSTVDEHIKSVLRDFIGSDKDFEIFTVWKCKVLQNTKWLMCTDLPDVKYYELSYNGDKRELYIDEYVKERNNVIKNPFGLC